MCWLYVCGCVCGVYVCRRVFVYVYEGGRKQRYGLVGIYKFIIVRESFVFKVENICSRLS
jgi:hypothetical protein